MAAAPVIAARRGKDFDADRMSTRVLARDRVIPATARLAGSLPFGGLQRGTTVVVTPGPSGSTTLSLELLAGVSQAGHWCAVAGMANLGLRAAAEHGVDLERLIVVPWLGPPGRWQQVLATLFDGAGAVLFSPAGPVRAGDARKLSARAKDRGSVLIVLDQQGRWSEPGNLRCRVGSSSWSGLGNGHGLLSERTIEVEVSGRGAAARPRRSTVNVAGMDHCA